ncbi:hypothetical protein [Chryseobacterium culicis]|uniref:hypothetical protein n=1 Tax=Chryseobacterium culicis TaxID=680127 RepID=UPI001874762D|nr:hypothetical protein [Chryseobacterium culicis]MBE4949913.1 hypothetical protein [Chryseobacterium culicis]
MSSIRDISLIIQDLAPVPGLKFVGGTSLFIQNKVETINDVDVLVQDLEGIMQVYEIELIPEPIYKFQGRQRGYYIYNDIMIDVFVQENDEETILIGTSAHCSTVNAQIQFLEKTLKLSLSPEKRQSTIAEIEYLKTLR